MSDPNSGNPNDDAFGRSPWWVFLDRRLDEDRKVAQRLAEPLSSRLLDEIAVKREILLAHNGFRVEEEFGPVVYCSTCMVKEWDHEFLPRSELGLGAGSVLDGPGARLDPPDAPSLGPRVDP